MSYLVSPARRSGPAQSCTRARRRGTAPGHSLLSMLMLTIYTYYLILNANHVVITLIVIIIIIIIIIIKETIGLTYY